MSSVNSKVDILFKSTLRLFIYGRFEVNPFSECKILSASGGSLGERLRTGAFRNDIFLILCCDKDFIIKLYTIYIKHNLLRNIVYNWSN